MKLFHYRLIALTLVSLFLLPLLAGCGKSEKAMQSPDGLSNRERRQQNSGTGQ
jgi:hypothetical protein